MTLYIVFFILLIFTTIPFCILIYNYFTVIVLNSLDQIDNEKKLVSILIPARNEELNIRNCVMSCIDQTYENIEVIILDDSSEDKTAEIVNQVIAENPSKLIKLFQSKELPEGWKGKNWACHNLSMHAKGDYLLFVDADVSMRSNAVNSCLFNLEKTGADMITVFPTQIMKTIGEKLLVDLVMNWTFFSLIPFKATQNLRNTFLTPVVGQFLMMTRESYFESGGHEAVKNEVIEDKRLGVNFKKKGFGVLPVLGNGQVYCRMYRSTIETYKGFEKNSYRGSQMDPITYIFFLFLVPSAFYLPIVLSFYDKLFLIIILMWIIGLTLKALAFKQPVYLILLFPFQILSMIPLGISSMIQTTRKKTYWKGRQM